MKSTLNKIRDKSPCPNGWEKLLNSLGKTGADDTAVSIAQIVESNGIDDALWCLCAVEGYEKEKRLFAVWCSRRVEYLNTDPRVKSANDAAESFANGEIDAAANDAARAAALAAMDAAWAARDAAWAASGAARAASAAAWAASGAARAASAAASAANDAASAANDAAWDARDAEKQMLLYMCKQIESGGEINWKIEF